MRRILDVEPRARVDYAEIVDAMTFEPVVRVSRSSYALLAVFIGKTRLIDNLFIEPGSEGSDELRIEL
jgi:pantoate--beta-alanine ligase